MSDLLDISDPTELPLLVSFFDLKQYARFARTQSPRENFDFISEYYEFVGDILEPCGVEIVKFIGDAGLVVCPEGRVNEGVLGLLRLKKEGDSWLADRGSPCRHIIKAHFGSAWCGEVGTRSKKRFDLFGLTVMTAAVVRSSGFAMTPQLFRKLDPASRKAFKKHTPPVTYIPVEQPDDSGPGASGGSL